MTAETCGMPRHAGEGRAALEVDEHQVELLGRVGHRQAEHQGAQELRLAGAGRADHQAVRAHALLGGLLDVEVDRRAVVADADRHPQPVAGRARAARRSPGRRCARRRARAGRMKVGRCRAERVARGPVPSVVCSGASRRANASARGQVALVGRPPGSPRAAAAPVIGRPAVGPAARPRTAAAAGSASSSSSQRSGQVEHGDAVQAVGGMTWLPGGSDAAVDDEQDVRGRGRSSAPKRGRSRGPAAAARPGRRARWRPSGSGRRRRCLGAQCACGSHLTQSQSGEASRSEASTATTRCSGEWKAAARADHRPGQGAGLPSSAPQTSIRSNARRSSGGRQVGLHPVHDEQPVQRRGGGRVEPGRRRRSRAAPARARAAARTGRSGRAGSSASGDVRSQTPGAVLGERGQGAGSRVVPEQRSRAAGSAASRATLRTSPR